MQLRESRPPPKQNRGVHSAEARIGGEPQRGLANRHRGLVHPTDRGGIGNRQANRRRNHPQFQRFGGDENLRQPCGSQRVADSTFDGESRPRPNRAAERQHFHGVAGERRGAVGGDERNVVGASASRSRRPWRWLGINPPHCDRERSCERRRWHFPSRELRSRRRIRRRIAAPMRPLRRASIRRGRSQTAERDTHRGIATSRIRCRRTRRRHRRRRREFVSRCRRGSSPPRG